MSDRYLMKFWHKELKSFVEFDNEGLYINYNNGQIYTRSGSLNVTDHYIRVQCTGLKDRNGKLIYEGDVVKICWRVEPAIYVVEMMQRGQSGFPMWQFSNPLNSRFYSGSGGCDVEIIGNIHQHPELVEG
tara:strand:+ start:3158 stop:3547 length:390 start_codon:yes stop_codon:yes gene_type:complete